MNAAFALRTALRSLRKDVGHTVLMVVAFTLGLATFASAEAARDSRRHLEQPNRDRVYVVEIRKAVGDPPAPSSPGERELLAYRDRVLLESPTPSRASDVIVASGAVTAGAAPPRSATLVFVTRHAPALNGLGLAAGGFWSELGDRGEERSVVLTAAAAATFFDGAPAVGRELRVFGERFVVAGVLADGLLRTRRPLLFLPSALATRYEVRPIAFRTHDEVRNPYSSFLASENTWIELWVELADAAARARYEAELDAYVREQKALGRPLLSAHLVPKRQLDDTAAVDAGTELFALFAAALLLGASLNLARLLDVKFRAKRAETAVHRAFGASFGAVLGEHLLEAALVAVFAAALAVPLGIGVMFALNRAIVLRPTDYVFGAARCGLTLLTSIGIGLAAGFVPALRAARAVPAEGLRRP